jgi:hypothetical protein
MLLVTLIQRVRLILWDKLGRPVSVAAKNGHFGGIVAVISLAATTSGISPRSGSDDSLLDFSLQR